MYLEKHVAHFVATLAEMVTLVEQQGIVGGYLRLGLGSRGDPELPLVHVLVFLVTALGWGVQHGM